MPESDAVPLPRAGEVFFDVRGAARSMRLSWYAESRVAVFSIWQGDRCTGTFRLPFGDLARMAQTLQRGPGSAAADPGGPAQAGRAGRPSHAAAAFPESGGYPAPAAHPPRAVFAEPGAQSDQVPYPGQAGYPDQAPYPGHPDQAPYPGYPDQAPYPGHPDQAPYPGHPDQAPYPGHPDQAPYPGHPDQAPYPGHPDQGPYQETGGGYPDQAGYPRHGAYAEHRGRSAGHPGSAGGPGSDVPGSAVHGYADAQVRPGHSDSAGRQHAAGYAGQRGDSDGPGYADLSGSGRTGYSDRHDRADLRGYPPDRGHWGHADVPGSADAAPNADYRANPGDRSYQDTALAGPHQPPETLAAGAGRGAWLAAPAVTGGWPGPDGEAPGSGTRLSNSPSVPATNGPPLQDWGAATGY